VGEGGGGEGLKGDSSKFSVAGQITARRTSKIKDARISDAESRARAIRWRCNFIYPPSREEILRTKQKRATRTSAGNENPAGNSAACERRAT
jgi:hypothetical protein